jgi:hypothetical protein
MLQVRALALNAPQMPFLLGQDLRPRTSTSLLKGGERVFSSDICESKPLSGITCDSKGIQMSLMILQGERFLLLY